MKTLFIVIILVSNLYTGNAFAQTFDFTGNDLHALCELETDPNAEIVILSFIEGVNSGTAIPLAALGDAGDSLLKALQQNGSMWCVPDNVNRAQVGDIFCKYLKEHPENRQEHAVNHLRQALIDAWSC